MEDRAVDEVTGTVIGAAIAVHRALGPGLLESTYLSALCIELSERGLRHRREVAIPIFYRGTKVGAYRVDLIVEDRVLIEVKSVEYLHAVFEAQVPGLPQGHATAGGAPDQLQLRVREGRHSAPRQRPVMKRDTETRRLHAEALRRSAVRANRPGRPHGVRVAAAREGAS